jgi:DNA-binding transcriptional MerR regulator
MVRMAGGLIGDVAKRAGVSPPTIRYYEEIGLLPAPARSSAGYRRYPQTTVDELLFIRKAQALGFSLDEVAEILKLSRSGKPPCSHVLSLAHQHLAAVDERIRQLQRFRQQLAAELAKWDGKNTPTCRGLCQIIASAEPGTDAEDVNLHLKPRRARRQKGNRR